MNWEFVCSECAERVFDATGSGERGLCFLCQWVRDSEPDPAKRAALRRELDRE